MSITQLMDTVVLLLHFYLWGKCPVNLALLCVSQYLKLSTLKKKIIQKMCIFIVCLTAGWINLLTSSKNNHLMPATANSKVFLIYMTEVIIINRCMISCSHPNHQCGHTTLQHPYHGNSIVAEKISNNLMHWEMFRYHHRSYNQTKWLHCHVQTLCNWQMIWTQKLLWGQNYSNWRYVTQWLNATPNFFTSALKTFNFSEPSSLELTCCQGYWI